MLAINFHASTLTLRSWRPIVKIYFSLINRLTIFLSLLLSYVLVVNAADTPKLLKATPLSQTAIQLQFDAQLEAETAEDLANYQIAPDAQVEYALLDERLNRVLLLTYAISGRKNLSLHAAKYPNRDSYNPPTRTNEITFGAGDCCYLLQWFTRYHITCQ